MDMCPNCTGCSNSDKINCTCRSCPTKAEVHANHLHAVFHSSKKFTMARVWREDFVSMLYTASCEYRCEILYPKLGSNWRRASEFSGQSHVGNCVHLGVNRREPYFLEFCGILNYIMHVKFSRSLGKGKTRVKRKAFASYVTALTTVKSQHFMMKSPASPE